MKRLPIIIALFACAAVVSCDGVKREPSDQYMPDMAYSRAYETYADHSELNDSGINYNNMPVAGTMARGDEFPFPLAKDKAGDSTNYNAAKAIKNPITFLTGAETGEAERLYLIQCGICHGTALDGNGPLYNSGNGKFSAKPATFVGDAKYEAMPEGQMFYSTTYGKNLMGPYGAQLTRKQRWMVIYYIKQQQAKKKATAAPTAGAATADTTAAK
jgi:hypothetical protein